MITMNDFRAEPKKLRQEMTDAVARVLESGWFVLGPEVREFERKWAEICGAPYAVGVGNGMDAIEIILRSLDIGRGDEVICPAMTAFATVLAVMRTGATPVLADIDPSTGLLSIESAQRCISLNTKAVILVHLYGQVRGMEGWQKFCLDNALTLIEDCAQSHLAAYRGSKAGAFGAAGAYSFYPTKNLGAIGDAGGIVTRDAQLASRAMKLRNYGQSERYRHVELGLNSRLDELQAAMLGVRLKWLDAFTIRRREIASAYRRGIRNPAISILAAPEEQNSHVYHLFVVTSARRNELQKHLHDCGIETLIHYPIPLHHQDPCKALPCDPTGLRSCEKHAETCISLPCHPQLADGDVEAVIQACNSFRG